MQFDTKAYLGLRQVALSEGKGLKDEKVGTMVIDLPIDPGVFITFALRRNGECSIYFCNGGGYLGCQSYPQVANLTKKAFSILDELKFASQLKESPEKCQVPLGTSSCNMEFYFVSRDCIQHRSEARHSCTEMISPKSPLVPLFSILDDILTVMREQNEGD
jgi:hypothetical protein